MIFLSLNIRGVGGPHKSSAFRSLLARTSPDIILLQETLVDGLKARTFLSKYRPDWHTCSVNSLGSSGGLAAAWDPSMFDLQPFLSCAGLLLTGTCKWNSQSINLLNVYGPCQNRRTFWQQVESQGLLDLHNLVLAGDLNFTLNSGETWGLSTLQDPLAEFFTTLFHSHGLVDIPPAVSDSHLAQW
jgi:hypothetical protein